MGLGIETFWRSTPRTVCLVMEASGRRLEREHNARAWLAWNVAALMRAKRLPTLKSLMVKRRRREQQAWEDQIKMCRLITAAYSGRR